MGAPMGGCGGTTRAANAVAAAQVRRCTAAGCSHLTASVLQCACLQPRLCMHPGVEAAPADRMHTNRQDGLQKDRQKWRLSGQRTSS